MSSTLFLDPDTPTLHILPMPASCASFTTESKLHCLRVTLQALKHSPSRIPARRQLLVTFSPLCHHTIRIMLFSMTVSPCLQLFDFWFQTKTACYKVLVYKDSSLPISDQTYLKRMKRNYFFGICFEVKRKVHYEAHAWTIFDAHTPRKEERPL